MSDDEAASELIESLHAEYNISEMLELHAIHYCMSLLAEMIRIALCESSSGHPRRTERSGSANFANRKMQFDLDNYGDHSPVISETREGARACYSYLTRTGRFPVHAYNELLRVRAVVMALFCSLGDARERAKDLCVYWMTRMCFAFDARLVLLSQSETEIMRVRFMYRALSLSEPIQALFRGNQ
jgi:hypothetical protein